MKKEETIAGKLTIKLTDEQQTQIKVATGKSLTELSIDVTAAGTLSEKDLDQVAGGWRKKVID